MTYSHMSWSQKWFFGNGKKRKRLCEEKRLRETEEDLAI